MKAMILAAGFGTRLRPVTYTLPKPMVPLCNRPLIAYAIEAFLAADVRDLIVNLHHLPEAIERYLTDTFGGEATFHFSREQEILGTGGGVRKVRPLLESETEFFLVNADTIQFPRYAALRQARHASDALAALTLRHPPEGDRFTPVFFDGKQVTGFGHGIGEPLMFSGSHLISSRIFGHLPDRDFSGIVDSVYQPVLDAGTETLAGVVDDGLWFDIGTPQRYLAAASALLDLTLDGKVPLAKGSRIAGSNIVHETAHVAATGHTDASTIGAASNIEGVVRNSSIWDRCHVAAGVKLDGCIVAHDVELISPLELHDALICRDDASIPRDAGYRFEQGLAIFEPGQ